jgi:hypothetical protein
VRVTNGDAKTGSTAVPRVVAGGSGFASRARADPASSSQAAELGAPTALPAEAGAVSSLRATATATACDSNVIMRFNMGATSHTMAWIHRKRLQYI